MVEWHSMYVEKEWNTNGKYICKQNIKHVERKWNTHRLNTIKQQNHSSTHKQVVKMKSKYI